MKKKCAKCGTENDESHFCKDNSKADGFSSWCRACRLKNGNRWRDKPENKKKTNQASLDYYHKNAESINKRRKTDEYRKRQREYVKEWRKTNPQQEQSKKYALNNPDKRKATAAIGNAISAGKITRPLYCERCGIDGVVQGHHESYKKEHWLDVIWLCPVCHKARHQEIKKGIKQWLNR